MRCGMENRKADKATEYVFMYYLLYGCKRLRRGN